MRTYLDERPGILPINYQHAPDVRNKNKKKRRHGQPLTLEQNELLQVNDNHMHLKNPSGAPVWFLKKKIEHVKIKMTSCRPTTTNGEGKMYVILRYDKGVVKGARPVGDNVVGAEDQVRLVKSDGGFGRKDVLGTQVVAEGMLIADLSMCTTRVAHYKGGAAAGGFIINHVVALDTRCSRSKLDQD